MASLIARRAFTTSVRRFASSGEQKAGEQALKSESKKNPEILVRQIICRRKYPLRRQQLQRLTENLMDRSSAVSWSALSPAPVSTLVRSVLLYLLFRPPQKAFPRPKLPTNIYVLPSSSSRPHPHQVHLGEHCPSRQEQHALGERRDRGQVPVLPRR